VQLFLVVAEAFHWRHVAAVDYRNAELRRPAPSSNVTQRKRSPAVSCSARMSDARQVAAGAGRRSAAASVHGGVGTAGALFQQC